MRRHSLDEREKPWPQEKNAGIRQHFQRQNRVWHFPARIWEGPGHRQTAHSSKRRDVRRPRRGTFRSETGRTRTHGIALPGGKSPYLVDYAERWLADYQTRVKPTTYRTRAGRIKACTDVIGYVRLKDLTPEHIRHCMRVLGSGSHPARSRTIMSASRWCSTRRSSRSSSPSIHADASAAEDGAARGGRARPGPAQAHDRGRLLHAAGQTRSAPCGGGPRDVGAPCSRSRSRPA